jgi:thiamine-monophosphate kinase
MPTRTTSHEPQASVADCSERELIARIQRLLAPAPPWLLVGIGDDAAIVEPERNRVEVLTVDAIVEGVHFDRGFVPPDAIGHRALAVNLSDLAAMGAAPRLALLSMALPAALPLADFDAIAAGFTALAATHRLHVVGGNLTRSPGPLMIDVALVGTVKRRQGLTRAGAKPGDDLYVSGTIGSAAAGLRLLRQVASQQSPVVSLSPQSIDDVRLRLATEDLRLATEDLRLTTEDWRLMTAYLRPEPRVRLGLLLARNRAASACVDLSDGLADGARRIAEASGVGVMLDAGSLPIDPAARGVFEAQGLDPVGESIAAGDDYELLVAVRPRVRGRLAAVVRHGGTPLTRIGRCTEDRDVTIRRQAGVAATEAALPAGYTHFR